MAEVKYGNNEKPKNRKSLREISSRFQENEQPGKICPAG